MATNSPVGPLIESSDDGHFVVAWERAGAPVTFKFRTLSAASTAVSKITVRAAESTTTTPLVSAFAEEWMGDYVAVECAAVTICDYRFGLRSLVIPRLGSLRLDEVDPGVVNAFVSAIHQESGFAMANRGRRTLSAMLGVAEKWGYVEANPVRRARC